MFLLEKDRAATDLTMCNIFIIILNDNSAMQNMSNGCINYEDGNS